MINLQEAKVLMANSIGRLLNAKGTINLNDVQADCINNACLYYLQKQNKAYSGLNAFSPFNSFDNLNPTDVGRVFGEATQAIIPQFTDAMIANSSLAVLQNSEWDGMWDFLENYFKSIHFIDIND